MKVAKRIAPVKELTEVETLGMFAAIMVRMFYVSCCCAESYS
jgi:hypothetical protein